jgi:hypothetical protein
MSDAPKRARTRRKSASFPKEFLHLLLHVADTSKTVKIEQLKPNVKATYTTFRARVNEFRKAYEVEARRGDPGRSLEIADKMYSVVLKDPVKDEEGIWHILVMPKESGFAAAIQAAIPESDVLIEEPDDRKDEEDAMKAIRGIYEE